MIRSSGHTVSSAAVDSGATLAVPKPLVPLYMAAGTVSASFNSPAQDIARTRGVAYQIVTTGLSGSWAVYGSCEGGPNNLDPGIASAGVVNWILVGSSAGTAVSQPVSGSTVNMVNLWNQNYRFARVQYTHVAGSGSFDQWTDLKEPASNE